METQEQIELSKEGEVKDYSQMEKKFLQTTIGGIRQRQDGMIEVPLPFKTDQPQFAKNRGIALQRTKSTLQNLRKKNPEMHASSLNKFSKNVDLPFPRFIPTPPQLWKPQEGYAYWIPLFSVWQKEKARIVFDARAGGIQCLNEQLLQGPDRNNALRAVILRARKGPYAFTADVENMFHQIAVPERQYTYLRFFWYQDNDPDKPLIEYISRVHLMGKTSSPAVANLAVRYAARKEPPVSGAKWIKEDDLLDIYQINQSRVPDKVERSLTKQFYVDDYVAAADTEKEAQEMITEGIRRFQRYDMKLCKVQ